MAYRLYFSLLVLLLSTGTIAFLANVVLVIHDVRLERGLSPTYLQAANKLFQEKNIHLETGPSGEAFLSKEEVRALVEELPEDQRSKFSLVPPELRENKKRTISAEEMEAIQRRDDVAAEYFRRRYFSEYVDPKWGHPYHSSHPWFSVLIGLLFLLPAIIAMMLRRWITWIVDGRSKGA